MSDYTQDEMEQAFIRIFSTLGNQIAKAANKAERRERVRAAICRSARGAERFVDTSLTFAEAFLECYGERLDRRLVPRQDVEGDDSAEEAD